MSKFCALLFCTGRFKRSTKQIAGFILAVLVIFSILNLQMTSGGTESLMMACLAYRNRAYKLGIKDPDMYVIALSQLALTPHLLSLATSE